MSKNIVIIVLVILCGGFLVYAKYQQAIAENALNEAEKYFNLAEKNASDAQNAQEQAKMAEEEAIKQRDIAMKALAEAEAQRLAAEEALKKCK